MATKTVTYSPGSCVRCGGDDGYEAGAGDVVQIFLDQDRNSNFPESISGIVVIVEQASVLDTSRTYTVQYESDDLAGAVDALSSCDILSLLCRSCCEILSERMDEWEAIDTPQVTLAWYWNGDGQAVLIAQADIVGDYEWFDPAGVSLGTGSSASHIIAGSDAETFAGGLYTVIVTSPGGLQTTIQVYVDPTRLKFRTLNTTITTGNSTRILFLNAGESIASVIQTTAGSGIMLESITYAGNPPVATLTFTDTPAVASVGLQILIQRNLP